MAERSELAPAVVAGQAAAAVAEVEAALTAAPDPTAAAFFDLDNTVVRGASIYHLARGLARRKFFTVRDVVGFASDQVKFRVFGQEDLADMADATEAALSFVEGHQVSRDGPAGQGDLRRVDRRQALSRHPGAGPGRTWTPASGSGWCPPRRSRWPRSSPSGWGSPGRSAPCRRPGDGVYTGRLVGKPLHGPAKAEAVRALAAREGLDLQRCAAYSDSSNDIPMLSLVGDPCAINPDTKLLRHARDLGWRVHDYRTGRKAAKIGLPVDGRCGGGRRDRRDGGRHRPPPPPPARPAAPS